MVFSVQHETLGKHFTEYVNSQKGRGDQVPGNNYRRDTNFKKISVTGSQWCKKEFNHMFLTVVNHWDRP